MAAILDFAFKWWVQVLLNLYPSIFLKVIALSNTMRSFRDWSQSARFFPVLILLLAEDRYYLTENKLEAKIFFAHMLPLGVLCQNPEFHRNPPIGKLKNPRWPPRTHKSMTVHKFHKFRKGSCQSIHALRGVKYMDIYTNKKSKKKVTPTLMDPMHMTP